MSERSEEVFEPETKKLKSDEETKEQRSDVVERSEGVSELEAKKLDANEETKEQAPKKKILTEDERRYMYDTDEYSDDDERDRDYAEYYRQTRESNGFAVSDFPKINLPGKTIPLSEPGQDPKLRELSELAIAFYNKENSTCYKLKEVLNATAYLVQGPVYNLTFTASEGDGSDAKCFRGSVWVDYGDHGSTSALECYLHEEKK